jgi:hypothetical protein
LNILSNYFLKVCINEYGLGSSQQSLINSAFPINESRITFQCFLLFGHAHWSNKLQHNTNRQNFRQSFQIEKIDRWHLIGCSHFTRIWINLNSSEYGCFFYCTCCFNSCYDTCSHHENCHKKIWKVRINMLISLLLYRVRRVYNLI